jgi:hypothetical protein
MIPSYRQADEFPRDPVIGYDYAKQLEAEKAPLTQRERATLLVMAATGILAAVALWYLQNSANMATLQRILFRISVGHAFFVPLIYIAIKRRNGIRAASNQRLR